MGGKHFPRKEAGLFPELSGMKTIRAAWLALALGLTLTMSGVSQPVADPPFTINRKITLASVNRGGRVELFYDLSRYPQARGLWVECFRYQGPKGESKVAEWRLPAPGGVERLDFKDFPASQYYFVGHLLDAQNQPVAQGFRPVQLEYGGWTGRLRVEEATARRPASNGVPWADISTQNGPQGGDVFSVEPGALVVQPGKQAVMVARLNKAYMAEPLQWSLQGPGRLLVAENFVAYYQAEKTKEPQRATIRVFSEVHPNLRCEVQVLVTTESTVQTSPEERQP